MFSFIMEITHRRVTKAPLPPGPKGWPLIGNLLEVPSVEPWKVYAAWGEKWGGIMSVNVLGQRMIVVNSIDIAMNLLDGRSSNYSDRPILTMGGEIIGWNGVLAFANYGPRFKELRKLLASAIGSIRNVARYYPLEELEARRFVARVTAQPDEIPKQIRKTTGAIILMISHGYSVREEDDPIVRLAELGGEQLSAVTEPGAFLVDLIPALRYLPSWFPGTGWKKTAEAWRQDLLNLVNTPHQFVLDQLAAGTAVPSYTSDLLEDGKVDHDMVKWSAMTIYSAGADTTVSAIYTFFLAMTLYPEAQKKAQEEIFRVVGEDRLPTFADRDSLPYVGALVKEVLRWNPVGPLALPHRVTSDDVYEGYYIPKDSLVLVNVWKFVHDPEVYSNPFEFNPSRFLGLKPERDPREICFGFGRRVCPGSASAQALLYITAVMSLAVFDISKKVDGNGNVIEPIVRYTSTMISHPKPFECSVKPRSEKAREMIASVDL
ncbi:cytochrome P450 [Thelephora ganbajun]|uniref:Cytochrome P450 n=1 Tax=Thelephora ganbajun TaxID=370292 RepID=A0ACB6Z668_THEGA|nr:cytochrome P450 [Thelephora ganbajun]